MNFRQWLIREENTRNVIFCDLDETLIKTQYLANSAGDLVPREPGQGIADRMAGLHQLPRDPEELAQAWEEKGAKIIKLDESPENWKNNWFVTRPRPHANETLTALQQMGEVYILTSGGTKFQKEVIRVNELPISPEQVLGRDRYEEASRIAKGANAVLIDDLPATFSGAGEKLAVLNMKKDKLIQVQPWMGDEHDTALTLIPSRVKQALESRP